MAGRVAPNDSSALVKLVVAEPEYGAHSDALARWPDRASAVLLRTETVRALEHSGNEQYVANVGRLHRAVHLIRVDGLLLDRAGGLSAPDLRTLDAIHLAAGLGLGTDVGIMFVCDIRLRQAAEAYGLDIDSPA